MENNCLVTKLKGIVNNDSLPKFDAVVLNVLKDSTGVTTEGRFYIAVDKTTTINVIGNGAISTSSAGLISDPKQTLDIYTPTNNTIIYYKVNSGNNYQIEIKNKYGLVELLCVTPEFLYVDFSQLEYAKSLRILQLHSQAFTFEVNFNCSNLVSLVNLSDIPSNLAINIETLGNSVNVNAITLNSYAYGDIEVFVSGLVNNGRTSEATGIQFSSINSSHIYFGDNYLVNNGKLTWNGTSKITFITNFTDKVYCKGATAEEIAAWESGGKTVYVVE